MHHDDCDSKEASRNSRFCLALSFRLGLHEWVTRRKLRKAEEQTGSLYLSEFGKQHERLAVYNSRNTKTVLQPKAGRPEAGMWTGTERHGRPPSGGPPGPVRSFRKEHRSSRFTRSLRDLCSLREERISSFRIERTGPPDGGRPVSPRGRARAPEGERGADKDDAANRRNPAGGRKSGGSAATNKSAGVSNGGSS